MDLSESLGLLGFFAACFVVSSTGAIFMPGDWYEGLAKPPWNPPNWLFPPAWAILYATIAVAGWMVWRRAGFAGATVPLAIYGAQLVFNAGWSAVFFGLKRPDWAFFEVAGLWLSILATILAFYPLHQGAAWLLVPYLCWVSFAGALNFSVWRRNRARYGWA